MIYLNIPLNTLSEVWAPLALGYLGGLLKIILQRNRFLGFLLVVEFTAVITITFLIIVVGRGGRGAFVLFFFVLSVCLSCLGLAFIVVIVQTGVKEIELFSIKV